MHAVTSFHSSNLRPEQLSTIVAELLALERARAQRRLLVIRFGLLAVFIAVAGAGFHWLSPFATWLGISLCSVAPIRAWVVEIRCDWRLTNRLEEVPGGATHLVAPPAE